MKSSNGKKIETRGYAPVNGLKMYYEIEGTGEPLVYIPPAFGYAGVNAFPTLRRNHQVITMDLQGHGRTADIPERPITFDQHAADVIGLLDYLGIDRADLFGESFGGVIATLIAVRHPTMVNRLITYGATFGKPQDSLRPELFRTHLSGTAETRDIQFQRENYKKVAPDPEYWPTIWKKVFSLENPGFSKEELVSIQAPFLIIQGDHDFVRIEHSVESYKTIPNAELAIIPDAGHFILNWNPQKVIPTIETFLSEPSVKIPFATPEIGYHPGETR
jgi:pimeloyl-ACP methyl ester carboxylesterase